MTLLVKEGVEINDTEVTEVLMWWSAQTWTTLLDLFAPHAPSHRLRLTVSGLVKIDALCTIMTIIPGVGWGSL